MNTPDMAKATIVGGGIASLSAAVLLIRDAGFRGANIRILEELEVAGGALDGSGDPVKGYVTRGGRMFTEETYVCLWDVLQSVPSLDDPAKLVKDQVWAFNDEWRGDSRARLIDRHRRILDAKNLQPSRSARTDAPIGDAGTQPGNTAHRGLLLAALLRDPFLGDVAHNFRVPELAQCHRTQALHAALSAGVPTNPHAGRGAAKRVEPVRLDRPSDGEVADRPRCAI
jgi:hypothetical protein